MKTRFTLNNYLKSMTSMVLIFQVMSILSLQSQDFLISFMGSGGSTTVDSVRVENMTQGTKLKMVGSDILHLKGFITAIETTSNNENGNIIFYPNPMKEYSRMEFALPEAGETSISLYEISGKKVAQIRDLLATGRHIYGINGIGEGLYFVTISSGKYLFGGRLIAIGSQKGTPGIVYESSIAAQEKQTDLKGTAAETVMQYTTGDMLMYTGISGIYSTVVTDVPTSGKTITFGFIACTDGDGNNYPVVQIGSTKGTSVNSDPSGEKSVVQNWMAKNLRTTKLSDGINIPEVTEPVAWLNLYTTATPAYCWYDNNIGYKNVYGALYNWYAVNTNKLCPAGWHVPTNTDWDLLTTDLGGFAIAGGKLKEKGLSHWINPNTFATNETGFTALPGGVRKDNDGLYDRMGYTGSWWSATESSSTYAWAYFMGYFDRDVRHSIGMKRGGLTIRCLKD